MTRLADISRHELFAGVFLLACANGLAAKAADAVHRLGWGEAVVGTFDVSAIVVVACVGGLWLLMRDAARTPPASRRDLAAAGLTLPLILLPVGGLSWLAVSGLALYLLQDGGADPTLRRGATILLAVTVPMLWSSLLFQFLAHLILSTDAALVGWLLGTERTGNMVRFLSGEGYLVVFPACSSLANMSLAILCWVTVTEIAGHRRVPLDAVWCALACASVVAVNVGRMALMGLDLRHYEAIHSQTGDAVAGLIILAATIGWSLLGARRELFAAA